MIFMNLKPATQTAIFKMKHFNITQSKDILIWYLYAEEWREGILEAFVLVVKSLKVYF